MLMLVMKSFNGRNKKFDILDERFRRGVAKHRAVFEAVCVCVQYNMENGHPMFDIFTSVNRFSIRSNVLLSIRLKNY